MSTFYEIDDQWIKFVVFDSSHPNASHKKNFYEFLIVRGIKTEPPTVECGQTSYNARCEGNFFKSTFIRHNVRSRSCCFLNTERKYQNAHHCEATKNTHFKRKRLIACDNIVFLHFMCICY